MTVAELIDKLKEYGHDMKVTTFADYDESGYGDLHSLWESDYMKADMSYLVHLSKSASDHKYFVGVFTGRFKDTLL